MENFLMYITILLIIIVIGLVVWLVKLSKRLTNLSRGTQSLSLEEIIAENNNAIKQVMETQENHKSYILELQHKILNTIQNVAVVRFNPFKDTGGNQSFAIALTDEHKNGVIISSLYARERVSVFAKPITEGGSSFQLTKEEEQALSQAHK